MTCIVGLVDKGAVWIGGDSAAVDQSHYLFRSSEPKVFRNGPYIIGYTTSFRMGQLLQYKFAPPIPPINQEEISRFMATDFIDSYREMLKSAGALKVDSSVETCGVFLVGVAGKLYHVDNDFSVLLSADAYFAVGSGTSVAYGAMFATADSAMCPRERIQVALKAAASFTTSVCAPFFIAMLPAPLDLVCKL